MGKAELKYIPLSKIRVNKVALRDVNRQGEDFIQLIDSVRRDGVQQSISVRNDPGSDGKEYTLVDGLQRFSASLEVGTGVLNEFVDGPDGKPEGVIPAQVVEADEVKAMLAQIISNAHRIITKPVEYKNHLMRILGHNPTWTYTELGNALSKSPAWIGQMMSLNKLSKAAETLVNDGKIPLVNAYVLAKLPHEEQENWLERAQTMESMEFSTQALARAKEIRDSNRAGRDAAPEEFKPVSHLRKKPEIDAEAENPTIGPALINEVGLLGQSKDKADAARRAFQLALLWVTNLDPKSVEAQKQKDAERRKAEADARTRRDAEKAKKKADELAKKKEEADKAAAAAIDAAAKLPADPTPV